MEGEDGTQVDADSVGLFSDMAGGGKGATLPDCIKQAAKKLGVVVSDSSLFLGVTFGLDEYLRLQAGNMGMEAEIGSLPPRIDENDLPLLVQHLDGSFAVVEECSGRSLTIWDTERRAISNDDEGLDAFKDWSCSLRPVFETDKVPFLSFPWFTGQVSRLWPYYSQVVLASFVIHSFTLVIPLLLGIFYDRILPNLAENSLRVLVIGAFIALVFDYVLKNVRASLVEKAALRVEREAEPHLLAQVLDTMFSKLPPSPGHLTHAVQEFSRIKSLFTTQLVMGFIDFFFLFFFLLVIYLNSGILFLVPASISLFVLGVAVAYGFIIDHNVSSQSKLQSRKTSFLNEVFQGVESIKTTNAARLFVSRWATEVEKAGEMASRYRIAQARCTMTTGFLGQLNTAGLLVVAFFLIKNGNMSSGGLLATMVLSGRCIAVSAAVANLITSYLFAKRSYEDLREILSLEKESADSRQFKIQQLEGAVRFEGVSFRYSQEAPYALENVSFSVKPGEKVGIIGPMGSGKSTLLKLLTGLATPSEGVILLDEHNMAALNLQKVREFMGVVPQSPVLFNGTLEFNLLMGSHSVSPETLHAALTISGIDTFVSKHPLGLKMPILEGGKNLSQGQRQAVAIARALISDPLLLLMDEPTSSMDSSQEKKLLKRVRETMADRTLLIVTHRPHMLQAVERIIVIDQGRLVADGPREEILGKLAQPIRGKPNG